MTSIPMRSGYSPQHWQSCIDAMILKKEGSRAVGILRTIMLFESDFNFMNKYIGQKMLQRATKIRLLYMNNMVAVLDIGQSTKH